MATWRWHGCSLNTAPTPTQQRPTAGLTALMAASHEGHVEVARLLLEHSADPNTAMTEDGCCCAASWHRHGGHLSVAQLLAAHGAAVAHDIDNDGRYGAGRCLVL